jgi:hypothetical protein
VTSWRVASQRYQRNRPEDGHTFFFGLDDRHVIDGARGGNSARWLNHCCEPNCEAVQEGSRVFIRAIADIMAGEELSIDYLGHGTDALGPTVERRNGHLALAGAPFRTSSVRESEGEP